MEEGWRRAAVGKMVAVAIVAVALLGALSAAAILQPQKAWADDGNGPYAMIYKNPGSYTYTLVFQNDNVPDSRYGTLAEEHDEVICDSEDTENNCRCWNAWRTNLDVTKVIVRDPMSPHSMASWFDSFRNLESVDLGKLDTSQVTDMSDLFYGCNNLKSLDLRNFNTANVRNFNRMFEYCYELKSVNLSSFQTSKATDMAYMFEGCHELESLDLSSFNMRNVLDATSMFPDWGKLATVKVGTNTNVRALLPVPDRDYVEGATGKWVSATGAVYDPASIPAYRADTYKAQRGYSVANMDISLSDYWFDYSGRAIEPVVAVTLDYSTKLRPGIDYTVAYKNNVNAGTASVVITGKGNYGGNGYGNVQYLHAQLVERFCLQDSHSGLQRKGEKAHPHGEGRREDPEEGTGFHAQVLLEQKCRHGDGRYHRQGELLRQQNRVLHHCQAH